MKMKRDKWQVTGDKTLRASHSASRHLSPVTRHISGFTLIEVMFAVVAFCTATFAILALVSQSLEIARRLQRPMVDAGLVATIYASTNIIVEGEDEGNLADLCGKGYEEYNWAADKEEVQTNKLFDVNIVIQRGGGSGPVVSKTHVQFYKPDSPPGHLDGGNFTR